MASMLHNYMPKQAGQHSSQSGASASDDTSMAHMQEAPGYWGPEHRHTRCICPWDTGNAGASFSWFYVYMALQPAMHPMLTTQCLVDTSANEALLSEVLRAAGLHPLEDPMADPMPIAAPASHGRQLVFEEYSSAHLVLNQGQPTGPSPAAAHTQSSKGTASRTIHGIFESLPDTLAYSCTPCCTVYAAPGRPTNCCWAAHYTARTCKR